MSVTVCIPVWNRMTFLARALESVGAQTSRAEEVLVIDDGSVDPVPKTAPGDVVQVVRITHRGPQNAWNAGLMLANGNWFLPLADDDWLAPNFLEQALKKTRVSTDVVLCGMQEHGGSNTRYIPRVVTIEEELRGNCFPYTALFRTYLLLEMGGWHGQLAIYPDWGLWIDLLQRGARIALAPDAVVHYRTHAAQHSATITPDEHEAECARVREFYAPQITA